MDGGGKKALPEQYLLCKLMAMFFSVQTATQVGVRQLKGIGMDLYRFWPSFIPLFLYQGSLKMGQNEVTWDSWLSFSEEVFRGEIKLEKVRSK
ncbi:hypothetical protein AW736_00085 [Termitidicoccus mucosus]|uniref:Uncharacterized protein n=1 Tax=Termitidicoccus mucosus TaxID=1184151 RepID=A0A178IM99_9BACT|nr:hypothetical protein AW736_00085 [Opitutaceae bacterium TSB47]